MPAFTVSMPAEAVAYAEQRAAQDGISRSAWLTRLVLTAQLADEDKPTPEKPTTSPVDRQGPCASIVCGNGFTCMNHRGA